MAHYTLQDYALLTFFILVSLFAVAFIADRYRRSTPAQRRQIAFAAIGAVFAAGIILGLLAFR